MVKTHNITGLKYLCQTKQKDPYKYLGSGVHWRKHLLEHGEKITTEIIQICHTKEDLREWGLHYSKLWNVVSSTDWSNIMPEMGNGGWCNKDGINPMHRPDIVAKLSGENHHSHQLGYVSKLTGKNNPMCRKEVAEKNSASKASWSNEKRQEVLYKTSGKNNYRNQPGYDKNLQAGKNAPHADPTVYTFENTKTSVIEILTRYEMKSKYNLNQGNFDSMIRGNRRSIQGWILHK